MKMSNLMQLMCNTQLWQEMIDKADEKNLDISLIRELCHSSKRVALLQKIFSNEYNIAPPTTALIPKDEKGKFRTVYINTDLDRIILTLVNDCLCILFKDMIHKNCVSYQKGIGTQEIVQRVSRAITKYKRGYKTDFSKYFDKVSIERIDSVLNEIELKLGFEIGTEPVIEMVRRYYHQDLYFDKDGLHQAYQGLKQGCAVASFLANACLYELDEFMSKKYKVYYRYSDDICCIDKDVSHVVDDINRISSKANVTLNPKKVQAVDDEHWFKFLGFNIKGELITLSETRIKKFQDEIKKRSILRFKKSKGKKCANASKKLIYKYLYEGEHCWASSCLKTITSEQDLQELNLYIMDCIHAVETGKHRIGGLGCQLNGKEGVIPPRKGKHVGANKKNTDMIENYQTVKCMADNMKINMKLFETIVLNSK